MAKTQPTVAILYGFAEGSWHSRKLKKLLRHNGYKLTRDLYTADIIIAHSAGCYLIPTDVPAQLIIHSGYTYWPARTLLDSLKENLRLERKKHGLAKWLVRCTINDVYMLNIPQTMRMRHGWQDPGSWLDMLLKSRHIFVRSQHDPYCEPNELMRRSGQKHTYVSSPGNHNELWDNPEFYIGLLQSVYEERS